MKDQKMVSSSSNMWKSRPCIDHQAEPLKELVRAAYSLLLNESYSASPVSPCKHLA